MKRRVCIDPTYDQKDVMKKYGMNPYMWLVVKETANELVVSHRHIENKIRVLLKGEGRYVLQN